MLELRIYKLLFVYIRPLNFLSKQSKSITHLTLNLSFQRRIKKFTTKQTIKTIFLYLIYGFSNYVRFFPDTPLTYDTKRKLNRNKPVIFKGHLNQIVLHMLFLLSLWFNLPTHYSSWSLRKEYWNTKYFLKL